MIVAVRAASPILERITTVLVQRFRPGRVVLFGSRARGDAHEGSDYDLYLEMDEADPLDAVAAAMHQALEDDGVMEYIELHVRSASEYAWRRNDVGCLEYDVEREGVVLYERTGWTRHRTAQVREDPVRPSRVVALWPARAESDFRAMELVAADPDPIWDVACFHAHQGVEMLLKTLLVAIGCRLARTHSLKKLLTDCPDELRRDARLRSACAAAQFMSRRSRYGDRAMPTPERARAAVSGARTAREIVLPMIDRLSR